MVDFVRKFVPKGVWDKVRNAVLFRAEDPNNLSQVLPQMTTNVPVERIKGYRFPAPGSRTGAKVPRRASEDDIYDINFFKKDPANLPREEGYLINGTKPVSVSLAQFRGKTHGKRKITLLPYDPTGLRTTKTATWEALDKVLAANCKPDHLPAPCWINEASAVEKARADKGLPAPIGQFMNYRKQMTANFAEAKW